MQSGQALPTNGGDFGNAGADGRLWAVLQMKIMWRKFDRAKSEKV
jgi:hypothetical protein